MTTQFTLRPLAAAAVPRALDKAERYRLLNEPDQAESICLDVLAADPGNAKALTTLILALTDQFANEGGKDVVHRAMDALEKVADPYERAYHAGVIAERQARAWFRRHLPSQSTYDMLREAMSHYEKAEAIRPAGNDDAILRWNTCARMIMAHAALQPQDDERTEPYHD